MKKRAYEAQLIQLSLASTIPLLLLLLWVMFYANVSISLILLTALLASISIAYFTHQIYQKSAYKFRSFNHLLDAMIQGDYSLRARSYQSDGALGELVDTINRLAQRLSQQRWESIESQLLVETIIEHIGVAVIALSEDNQVKFLNPAAEKLLLLDETESNEKLLEQLTLIQSFTSGQHEVVELSLGYQLGRFNVHVEEFRESGMQHKLLFITRC